MWGTVTWGHRTRTPPSRVQLISGEFAFWKVPMAVKCQQQPESLSCDGPSGSAGSLLSLFTSGCVTPVLVSVLGGRGAPHILSTAPASARLVDAWKCRICSPSKRSSSEAPQPYTEAPDRATPARRERFTGLPCVRRARVCSVTASAEGGASLQDPAGPLPCLLALQEAASAAGNGRGALHGAPGPLGGSSGP